MCPRLHNGHMLLSLVAFMSNVHWRFFLIEFVYVGLASLAQLFLNAHAHTHTQLRDRSYTAPQRPVQIANEPLSSVGTPHFSKQISSPPTSSPSAYHPPHTSHTPLVQSSSVPASRRAIFPSPGTLGRGQFGGRTGYGHQESEYGELEFQGVTELLSDHDLLQEQSQRYQMIEKAMMRPHKGMCGVWVWWVCINYYLFTVLYTTADFPVAEIGASQYAIPGLEPELQVHPVQYVLCICT